MVHKVNCIACGSCYRECVLQKNAITVKEGGIEIELESCNACGHCVAVCPTGALSDHPLSAQQGDCGAALSAEEMLRVLRYPRSVRQYRSELVPKEVLEKLLDAGRYTQTGGNRQSISYLVLSGRDKVKAVAALYEEIARSLPDDDPNKAAVLGPITRQEERGIEDGLFYGCSQLIFTTCAQDDWDWNRSPFLCQHSIALMAPALGLGTCWSGQLENMMKNEENNKRFRALVGLGDDMRLCSCLMVGYPAVKFRRLVERNPLRVEWRGEEI